MNAGEREWLREDVTPEAVVALRLAADSMPLTSFDGPWLGAAHWLRRRANCFEAALAGDERTCRSCGERVMDCGHESTPSTEDHRDDEGRSGALRWLDCRCGHANADHWDGGECAHKGCMCGAPYDDEETP